MNLVRKSLASGSAAVALAVAVTAAALTVPHPASAGLLDSFLQHTKFPDCHDEKVLNTIIKRFNWAENQTWKRGFTIDYIERTRERLVQSTNVSPIPRRYCRGHAQLSNGRHPTLYYLIEGGQGLAGNGFNVEFCISGLDEWNEYDGSCRAIRY